MGRARETTNKETSKKGARSRAARGAPTRKVENGNGIAGHPAIPPPAPDAKGDAVARVRPTRRDRQLAEKKSRDVDDVCAAWAAIVAERMAADQTFAESVERYRAGTRDLRALFAWDALIAAESHLTLVNSVIARHLEGRCADPFAILEDLRGEQRAMAVIYAVQAFAAVLNQMSPEKPRWISTEDPRMAVLSLAHQTLGYALEAARIEAPLDLTEHILRAAQDESVWNGASVDRAGAACAAAAAFFRALGGDELASSDVVTSLYRAHARARQAQAR